MDIFHCPGCANTWNAAAGAVSPKGIATWYGASAVGAVSALGVGAIAAAGTEATGETIIGEHVLAHMDTYHLAGLIMAEEVVTSGESVGLGNYAGFGSRYVSYFLPGAVSGTAGLFIAGGHLLESGTFFITHALFEPF